MARATASDVDGIIEVDSDIDLTPFITVANELVTELCTDSGYTDERLKIIEVWLSAHFYRIRDTAVSMEKAGNVSQSFQYKVDLVLNQTRYGQTAMAIDTAGNLAQLNERIKSGKSPNISIGWLGTDYDTEEDD